MKKEIDWASQPFAEMSDRQLAQQLKVSPATVGKHRRRAGVVSKPSGGVRPVRMKPPPTTEDAARWAEMWLHDDLSIQQIAQRADVKFARHRISEAVRNYLGVEDLSDGTRCRLLLERDKNARTSAVAESRSDRSGHRGHG